MNLENWGENLQKEVHKEWKTKYESWEPGFKVFYGPISMNPKIMLISQNPGGNYQSFLEEDKTRFEAGDFSLPKETPYSNDRRMAKKMQDFFDRDISLLQSSVTFPVIFFRSKDTKVLKTIERFKLYEMERFCFKKVKEIIETLQPKTILITGMHTHQKLKEILGLFDEEIFFKSESGRLVAIESKIGNIKIFSMIHPTGTRINKNEWLYIKDLFYRFINE